MFLEKSRIFLHILNIQNLITSLNAKVCKKSLARDFLPEEVHHLLIENISAVVFAIVAGLAALTIIFISGPLQSYPESTNQQAASLQNAEFLLKASGPLHVRGALIPQIRLCTKCNAWSDGRLGNHNQQRRECVQRGLLLPAPPESHVQCTAGEFRLARAFRPGIPTILSSRHNHAELQIFLFEARRLSLSKPLLCGE